MLIAVPSSYTLFFLKHFKMGCTSDHQFKKIKQVLSVDTTTSQAFNLHFHELIGSSALPVSLTKSNCFIFNLKNISLNQYTD
jgi:hypothetical protein